MSIAPGSTPPPTSKDSQRRRFLKWSTFGMGGLAAALLATPLAGYLLGPLRKHGVRWVGLGPPSEFPINETRLAMFPNPLGAPFDGMAAQMGVYVRNLGENQFLVFAMNCAHLGCPVTWFPQSGLFMCPCHGGVYYENGDRASGPPPRGLFAASGGFATEQLENPGAALTRHCRHTLGDPDAPAKA